MMHEKSGDEESEALIGRPSGGREKKDGVETRCELPA